MEEEFTTNHEVHDKVQFNARLESEMESYDERMSNSLEDVAFVLRMQLLIAFLHHILTKYLHCIELMIPPVLDQHHLAERSATQHLHEFEVTQIGLPLIHKWFLFRILRGLRGFIDHDIDGLGLLLLQFVNHLLILIVCTDVLPSVITKSLIRILI